MSVKRMKLRLKIHPAGAVLAALGLMLFPSAGMLAAAAAMAAARGRTRAGHGAVRGQRNAALN